MCVCVCVCVCMCVCVHACGVCSRVDGIAVDVDVKCSMKQPTRDCYRNWTTCTQM